MFKEYYKKANDDIKPRHELVDEIFDKAEKITAQNRESDKIEKLLNTLVNYRKNEGIK